MGRFLTEFACLAWRSFVALAAGIGAAVPGPARTDAARSITVASYYFGNYHPGDPRNVKNKYLEAVRDVFGAKP